MKILLTETDVWQALKDHQAAILPYHMRDWFQNDPQRFQHFSLSVGDILLDYSKNRINHETMSLLGKLADTTHLALKIEQLFSGKQINSTEKRAALHTALRDRHATRAVLVDDKNIMPDIKATLEHMRLFSEKVRAKRWLGATGKPIQTIVNIGIGGSDLGPLMATHALSAFADTTLECHFISNIDTAHIKATLKKIQPETTLFIISSKSFTTLETITNLRTIKAWLQNHLGEQDLSPHFVAVTAALDQAMAFGIPTEQIFPIWEWVGGRYSIWSAIGLPLALMIGMEHFFAFLDGAHAMDQHFRQADFTNNMPVILALLGIWYNNFFSAHSHAIVPYTHHLSHFHTYLQQLEMESNGKSTTHAGAPVEYTTGPIIWGEQGCNGQHAFYQLFHQGKRMVPVDFILAGQFDAEDALHQNILVASALSQAQALMRGKSLPEATDELLQLGFKPDEAHWLAQHKTIPGNCPSNTLFLKKITPYNLGALIALYEHKVFVQGAIWDINSFDQWGVELGKQLLPQILADLTNLSINTAHDASTLGLMDFYRDLTTSEPLP